MTTNEAINEVAYILQDKYGMTLDEAVEAASQYEFTATIDMVVNGEKPIEDAAELISESV